MDLIEQAKAQFRLLDVKKTGFLHKDDLGPVVDKWVFSNSKSMKIESSSAASEIMDKLDVDKDGRVSLAEFIDGFDKFMYHNKVSHSVIADIKEGRAEAASAKALDADP